MKSIKPGRAPSKMSMIFAIGAAVFGVVWCLACAAMEAYFMIAFGLVFISMAVANAIYSYKNATSENRYSEFDIVDDDEEPDPLNLKYGKKTNEREITFEKNVAEDDINFCPYCGRELAGGFVFCPKCGKKLPE